MNLYIEIENGIAKNHPAFEENLLEAFGSIPDNWKPFIRVEKPILGPYQSLESDDPIYQNVNGVWTDVWLIRDLTDEEKLAKQQSVIDNLNSRPDAFNWSAWVLNKETCTMQPPIPYPDPDNGKIYRWCGAENKWKESPVKPTEGQYKFDFSLWQWVEVTI